MEERFQVGRIRAHLRNALAESNQNDSADEGDVKFLWATTAATNATLGGMKEAGGVTASTISVSISEPTSLPLGASAATYACAPNVVRSEANVGEMSSGQTTASNSTRIDEWLGNNAAVGISAGQLATSMEATGLSPPKSPSSAFISACGSDIPRGGEEAGVGRVADRPAALTSSETNIRAKRTQPPPQPSQSLARQLRRWLISLAVKSSSARCTCGVLLNPLKKKQIGLMKMQHVNSHLQIPLFECCLCAFTSTGYNHGNFYAHLRRRHPHLSQASVPELQRHCIWLLNEEIAGRLRRGLEHYFPTPDHT